MTVRFAQSEKPTKSYRPDLWATDTPNGAFPADGSRSRRNSCMRQSAWTSRIAKWVKGPRVRIALVVVLGTCLWAAAGRRERVVEHDAVANDSGQQPDEPGRPVARPRRIAEITRKLPELQRHRTDAVRVGPILDDYETEMGNRDQNIHAASFSAEVRANAPAWLTGTIEVDQ